MFPFAPFDAPAAPPIPPAPAPSSSPPLGPWWPGWTTWLRWFEVDRWGDARVFAGAAVTGCAFAIAAQAGFVTMAGWGLVTIITGCLLVSGRLVSPASRGLVAVAPLLSLALVVRSSPWVTAPVAVAVAVVLMAAVSFAGSPLREATFPALATRAALVVGHCALAPEMLRGLGDLDDAQGRTRPRAVALARGLGIALPVVAVLGGLLGSADPVFRSWFALPRLVTNLVLGLTGAWLLLGLCRAASAPSPAGRLHRSPALGAVEVVSVLAALCALYAAFVAAQLVALSGGADHVLSTSGLTYAEYARSGFFQLLATAAITLVVLLGLRACTDPGRPSVVAASEVTILLTLGIVVVAVRRLGLYTDAYGLTMLRLASLVTAVWIGLVFLLLAGAVARPSGRAWFAPAVVASGVVFVALWAAANPAAIVARINLQRTVDGSDLDVVQSVDLGADAVPVLVEWLDDLDAGHRLELRWRLCGADRSERGAFNWSHSQAERALDQLCATDQTIGLRSEQRTL